MGSKVESYSAQEPETGTLAGNGIETPLYIQTYELMRTNGRNKVGVAIQLQYSMLIVFRVAN